VEISASSCSLVSLYFSSAGFLKGAWNHRTCKGPVAVFGQPWLSAGDGYGLALDLVVIFTRSLGEAWKETGEQNQAGL